MTRATRFALTVAASAALVLAAASPGRAQGKSQQPHGKPSPPSRTTLPPPTAIGGASGTMPFAWVDDANVLSPGDVWLALSTLRWQRTDASEVYAPVIDAAIGIAPKLQLGVSAPRIVGSSDPGGAEGGLGTTYVHGKVPLFQRTHHGLKVSVAPTLEILGSAAVQAAPADQSRVHWGAPVSAQIDVGSGRLYGSTGYFSRGVWFVGIGAAAAVTPKLGVSSSFSRSWSDPLLADPLAPGPRRNELSGGASYSLSSVVGLFGSVGHTLATFDEYGAGATLSIGVSFVLSSSAVTK